MFDKEEPNDLFTRRADYSRKLFAYNGNFYNAYK